MIKFNLFLKLPTGEIVEVQKKFKQPDDEIVLFERYCNEVNDIVNSDRFKDAIILASSFGPL